MTGIPPSAWADEGERAVVTAVALLNEAHERNKPDPNDGPQMSG